MFRRAVAILGVDPSLILLCNNCNVAAAGPISPVACPARCWGGQAGPAGARLALPRLDTHSLSENWPGLSSGGAMQGCLDQAWAQSHIITRPGES